LSWNNYCAAALAGVALLPQPAPTEGLRLSYPLACKNGVTCVVQNYVDADPGHAAKDYRCGSETYHGHNGVDIRLADKAEQLRGISVLASAPGVVARLRDGAADISIRAPGAPSVAGTECGNGVIIAHEGGWETQYCHMAKGSLVVRVGDRVERGARLGQVGLSGMTEFPHLHLTVRHNDKVVDPFGPKLAPGTCSPIAGNDLWDDPARKALKYRSGEVLNSGFSDTVVTMERVEDGRIDPPSLKSIFIVGYVRAIHLRAGDQLVLTLIGPSGKVETSRTMDPLDRDEAQMLTYVGMRRPVQGWAPGLYRGFYQVLRKGQEVTVSTFITKL